ncbi:MAG: energy transducer TonB, partial [Chitinispirillaceae bacterium]|nr:energy transducer TonB [Chitinispirillaceae bacterium]
MGKKEYQKNSYSQIKDSNAQNDTLFFLSMLFSFLFFGSIGFYLHKNKPLPVTIAERLSKIEGVHFITEEEPKKKKIEKKREEVKKREIIKEVPKEPIDLTTKQSVVKETEEIVETSQESTTKQKVRKVYGLRRVYSVGIGAGGNPGDAIIGKRGNTLNTDIDTIKATEQDLKSQPVPISTVTTYPKVKIQVKPEYTKEMIENKIEGVVRARVLVDIDGTVKQVIVLDDLGYGSKEKTAEACF